MKTQVLVASLAVLAFAPLASVNAQQTVVTTAQPTTTTTQTTETNMAGTITSFTPGSSQMIVRSSAGAPTTYTYSKTTTFVDAAGNTVSYDSIKGGEPTTVYYTTQNGQPVVSKVVVNRVAAAPVTKTELPKQPPRRPRSTKPFTS